MAQATAVAAWPVPRPALREARAPGARRVRDRRPASPCRPPRAASASSCTRSRRRCTNGELQAVSGLPCTGRDGTPPSPLAAGDTAVRGVVAGFDTGAWSLYSAAGADTSLPYHQLTTGFLAALARQPRRHRRRAPLHALRARAAADRIGRLERLRARQAAAPALAVEGLGGRGLGYGPRGLVMARDLELGRGMKACRSRRRRAGASACASRRAGRRASSPTGAYGRRLPKPAAPARGAGRRPATQAARSAARRGAANCGARRLRLRRPPPFPLPLRLRRPVARHLDTEAVLEPELAGELRDLARLVVEHERDADAAPARRSARRGGRSPRARPGRRS